MISSIYPCLWLDSNTLKAAEYYLSIFPNSKIVNNTPMVTIFELNNTKFMAINGGPEFKFNEAISFVINCESQEEIDYYWNKLGQGGEEGKCGWLKDKYNIWWQVVPSILGSLMSNPETAPKTMYAFMQMKKFDIQKLLDAANSG
ncbi:MAG: VOC family protein [Saprospiraceae bacterium]